MDQGKLPPVMNYNKLRPKISTPGKLTRRMTPSESRLLILKLRTEIIALPLGTPNCGE